MKTNCKQMLMGGGKIAYRNLLTALLSLMLITMVACTDETESLTPSGPSLKLNVKTAGIETRGLIESATLPDGHSIGLTLTDAGGTTYDNISYNNIKATASTGATPQTWSLASAVNLSSTDGTLYGYYPYSNSVSDITQIPVTSGDTDYMYATPVTGLDDGNYNASVTMNHALAAIRLKIVKGTYTGAGSVTSVSIKSDNIATSGVLNAKTGALSSQSGVGTAITYNSAFTLSTTAKQIDQIIVPVTNSSAAPTFSITLDGSEYTATPSSVKFEQGSIYEYTLTIDSKGISLSDVKVGDWGYNSSGNPVIEAGYKVTLAGDLTNIGINAEIYTSQTRADAGSSVGDGLTRLFITAIPAKDNQGVRKASSDNTNATITQSTDDRGVLTISVVMESLTQDLTLTFYGCFDYIDLTTADNGVYAVAKNGKGITYADADESCIAVALIVNDAPTPQRLMIEKNGEANTTSIKAACTADGASYTSYKYFYWGMFGSDNTSITNYTQTGGGGTSSYGYLPQANGSYASSSNNLSGDYTTWTSGALSDFNGKANTAALLVASDTDDNTEYANMATWCRIFNQTATENQGYTDWYIPACGQLSLMYLNMTAINNALTKIGGQTISSTNYWSSSEYSSYNCWNEVFSNGYVGSSSKGDSRRVRFVRDIK